MKKSAGILPFREDGGRLFVFLVHPGGPFWKEKDRGAWSIAKGEFGDDEDSLLAARREFEEETGYSINGEFIALSPVAQSSRKLVFAWAVTANLDPDGIVSNKFEIEWPPKSGHMQRFSEVDKAAWIEISAAEQWIQRGQVPILRELATKLGVAAAASDKKYTPKRLK